MSENNMTNHSKSRVLTLLAVAAAIIGALLFMWRHHENKKNEQATVSVSSVPSIQSVPGAGNPSNQYVEDQNLQNAKNAEIARKNATASVPTITRSSFVGNPDEFAQDISPNSDSDNSPKQCSLKKVVVMYKPNPASCSLDNLRMARKTGVTAEELACQGCPTSSLRLAGYTAGDLKNIGYTAAQLKKAGFSDADLKAAGFSDHDINSVPVDPAVAAKLKKLKDQGADAAQLKKMGYTAAQLKNAGFSNDDLRKAGFTEHDIQTADRDSHSTGNTGLNASQMKNSGLDAAKLKKAGFTAAQLKAAGFSNNDLKNAGFNANDIAEASKIASGSKGLSAQELKAHGLTAAQLKKMGFNAAQLKNAGFNAAELKDAGFTAKDLKNAGFTASDLKAAGFTPQELKAAGYTAGQLKSAGYSADELKSAGFTPKELRDAGYTAGQLRDAGFTPAELRAAGYTRGDLLRAGFTPEEAGYAKSPVNTAQNNAVNPAQNTSNGISANTFGNTATPGASMPSVASNSPEARLAEIARLQQQQMNAQQKQDYIVQQQGAMTMQAQKLLAGWSNHSNQALAQKPADKSDDTNRGVATQNMSGVLPTPIIKAGTVLFAVLDTAVNSDQNSPIMAHVVAGPLKGAKLLGKFDRVEDRVLLNFYLVNDPRYPNSIPINAVAIDPDTARTAIADSVNYHYLLRYGTLFASAFVQGLSDAVVASHSTMVCGLIGCQQYMNGNLSNKDIAMVAAGKVGQQYAQNQSSTFNTPPTVKVSAGSGLGILFMSDVQMPTAQSIAAASAPNALNMANYSNNPNSPTNAPQQAAVKNQLLSLTGGN